MSAPQELKGPDFAAGVDDSRLNDGEPLLGHAAGEPIMLVKREGEVCAVGAVCTHYGGPLAEGIVEGGTIRCPWHHARFDLRTGAPARPGRDSIPCYRVERQDGRVRVRERLAPPRVARSAGPESAFIVGAGAAGNACAEVLRRQGYEGPITMFGSEATPPVDRTVAAVRSAAARNRRGARPPGDPRRGPGAHAADAGGQQGHRGGRRARPARGRHRRQLHRPGGRSVAAPAKDGGDRRGPRGPPPRTRPRTGARRLRAGAA